MPSLLRYGSLVCGIVYFAASGHQYPGSASIKGLSIILLAALALFRGNSLLGLALAVSSLGDVLLEVDPNRLFVPGLSAFLTAHVIYIVLFAFAWSKFRIGVVPVLLYALAFSIWLSPRLGALAIPVTLYICVITAMASTAICSRLPVWVPIGALLFLASDSLLAIAKFAGAYPLRDYLVWGTYYAAQFCITTGVLLTHNEPQNALRARSVGRP